MWSFLRPEPHRPLLPKEQIDPTYKRLRVQVFIGIFIGYELCAGDALLGGNGVR